MVIVDVVRPTASDPEEIIEVEVLWRSDVRDPLRRLFRS
jgi:hypothetical protein